MMSNWEKHSFISILQQLKPEVAIEIGNAEGGSLQVLNKFIPKVYALDLYEEVHQKLKPQFPNVEFLTGNSKQLLPELLRSIQAKNEKLGFVLIDGDHSTEGVKADINAVLENYIPVTTLIIIFHDSFNPECRKGITKAGWQQCPYVHFIDIDYVPGTYVNDIQNGKMQKRTMWGGLSLAILKPQKREHLLDVKQSAKELFDQTFKGSFYNTMRYRLRKILPDKKYR
jgi:hypothetical protein